MLALSELVLAVESPPPPIPMKMKATTKAINALRPWWLVLR
ncbi:hypothetical protein N624_0095 [Levilactobacillus brevis]|nr:hypothetical protein N624_0095 [Levilactobacillus brevis]